MKNIHEGVQELYKNYNYNITLSFTIIFFQVCLGVLN